MAKTSKEVGGMTERVRKHVEEALQTRFDGENNVAVLVAILDKGGELVIFSSQTLKLSKRKQNIMHDLVSLAMTRFHSIFLDKKT